MWVKSENSEPIIPAALERSGSNVILRRRFQHVEATEDRPEHYEWEEWQMTADQFEVYHDFEQQINEQSDALIELAELISEVI